MHICISKLTNIGSDNGLSPGQRQTIIWTNAGISSFLTYHLASIQWIGQRQLQDETRNWELVHLLLEVWWYSVASVFKLQTELGASTHLKQEEYCKISNIRSTKSQNLNVSRLGLQLSLRSILKPSVENEVENEDVVGAAPTGDASTTSEWSTI